MKAHISAHNGSCALRRLHNSRPGEDNGGQKTKQKKLAGGESEGDTQEDKFLKSPEILFPSS